MRQKLSIRQRVTCGIIAACTGFVYLGFCLYTIGGAWQRKEGDLPPVSPWLENATLIAVAYPFALVPGLNSIFIAPFLNAFFCSVIAGVIYVSILRRKMT
jgi:hypothetical protein